MSEFVRGSTTSVDRIHGDGPRSVILENGSIIVKCFHPYSKTCPLGNPSGQIASTITYVVDKGEIVGEHLISASEARRFTQQFSRWNREGRLCPSCKTPLILDL